MAQLGGRDGLSGFIENIAVQAHWLDHLGSAKLLRSNLSYINDAKPQGIRCLFAG